MKTKCWPKRLSWALEKNGCFHILFSYLKTVFDSVTRRALQFIWWERSILAVFVSGSVESMIDGSFLALMKGQQIKSFISIDQSVHRSYGFFAKWYGFPAVYKLVLIAIDIISIGAFPGDDGYLIIEAQNNVDTFPRRHSYVQCLCAYCFCFFPINSHRAFTLSQDEWC